MSSSANQVRRRRVAGERRSPSQQPRQAPALSGAPSRRRPAAPEHGTKRNRRHEGTERLRTGSPRPQRAALLPAAALVLALVALAAMLGLTLRGDDGQARATRAATSAARLGLEQMLSYNYQTFDTQSAAAQGLLTGDFKHEFASAMDKQIKPLAVKNKTVVQAKVSEVGVMKASPDSVTVLAFVNQAKVGSDTKQPTVDQNRVMATLSKVGERWLVSDVQAF